MAKINVAPGSMPRNAPASEPGGDAPQPDGGEDSVPGRAEDAAPVLLRAHREHLHASGLSDESIAAARIYSATRAGQMEALLRAPYPGIPQPPAIVIPYFAPGTTEVLTVAVRPDRPRDKDRKYEAPRGVPLRLYFPPVVAPHTWGKKEIPLILTEGVKKALVAAQHGHACVAASGVWCFHDAAHREKAKEWILHRDFGCVTLRDRPVYVVFDSDAQTNENVARASARLENLLARAGAWPAVVTIPGGPGGAKRGLDDFIVAEGPAAFQRLIKAAGPLAGRSVAEYRGEALADVVLRDAPPGGHVLRFPKELPGLGKALRRIIRPARILVIGGEPGAGKSTLVIALLVFWEEEGAIVAFISLDMDVPEATCRLGELLGLDGEKLEEGEVEEVERLRERLRDLAWLHILPGEADAERAVAALRQEFPDRPLVVAIDFVQLLPAADEDGTKAMVQRVETVRRIAVEHRALVVAISQLNRAGYTSEKKLSAFFGSSSIEQRAHAAVVIAEKDGELVAEVVKNRHGECVAVALSYDGSTGRFEETGVASTGKNGSGDLAQRILDLLVEQPGGLTRNQFSNLLKQGRNWTDLNAALGKLEAANPPLIEANATGPWYTDKNGNRKQALVFKLTDEARARLTPPPDPTPPPTSGDTNVGSTPQDEVQP
jgi:KaiC/GvpD/RAD55 family RecA-like ATPase